MQDAIILYENGKAIGGEGHPTDADDITFDNAGTDIVANKVGSAIKEVNEKTKHGIIELWENPDVENAFAGQSIIINNFDSKYDGIILTTATLNLERSGADWHEYDRSFLNASHPRYLRAVLLDDYNGKVEGYQRSISFSLVGSTLTISVSDATRYVLNSYGTRATSTTANQNLIPVRIYGIIHNN